MNGNHAPRILVGAAVLGAAGFVLVGVRELGKEAEAFRGSHLDPLGHPRAQPGRPADPQGRAGRDESGDGR